MPAGASFVLNTTKNTTQERGQGTYVKAPICFHESYIYAYLSHITLFWDIFLFWLLIEQREDKNSEEGVNDQEEMQLYYTTWELFKNG